jgi:alpha/beta superfamily hydrolase
VRGEEALTVPGLPGEPALEARASMGAAATRAVLLCHPHPSYGGSMHSAVVVAIAKTLAERAAERGDVAWLRFNFRGVGASGGSYAKGVGEVADARAALRALVSRAPRATVTVCGYSFGTWVGLRAAALEGGVERVALVAPAVRIFDFLREDAAALGGHVGVFVGDHDEFCSVEEAEQLARVLGASLQVFPGNDHFFLASRRRLADALLPFLCP